ncbi:MAG: hypothetical protein ACPG5M_07945 [Winogradskyella sp.]
MLTFILLLYSGPFLLFLVVRFIDHSKEKKLPQHPFSNKEAHKLLIQQNKNQIIHQFGEPDFRVNTNFWGYHYISTKGFWAEHHQTVYVLFKNNRLVQINNKH